jgi:hypothetical protein
MHYYGIEALYLGRQVPFTFELVGKTSRTCPVLQNDASNVREGRYREWRDLSRYYSLKTFGLETFAN